MTGLTFLVKNLIKNRSSSDLNSLELHLLERNIEGGSFIINQIHSYLFNANHYYLHMFRVYVAIHELLVIKLQLV